MRSSICNFSFATNESGGTGPQLGHYWDDPVIAPLENNRPKRYGRALLAGRRAQWKAERSGTKLIMVTAFATGIIAPSVAALVAATPSSSLAGTEGTTMARNNRDGNQSQNAGPLNGSSDTGEAETVEPAALPQSSPMEIRQILSTIDQAEIAKWETIYQSNPEAELPWWWWLLQKTETENGDPNRVPEAAPPSLLAPSYQLVADAPRSATMLSNDVITQQRSPQPITANQAPPPIFDSFPASLTRSTVVTGPPPVVGLKAPTVSATPPSGPALNKPSVRSTANDSVAPTPPTTPNPPQAPTADETPPLSASDDGVAPSQPAPPANMPTPPAADEPPYSQPEVPASEMPLSIDRNFVNEITEMIAGVENRTPNVTNVDKTSAQVEFDLASDRDEELDKNDKGRKPGKSGKPGKPGGKTIDIGMTVATQFNDVVSSVVDDDDKLTVTAQTKETDTTKYSIEGVKIGGSLTTVDSVRGQSLSFGLPPQAQTDILAGAPLPDKAALSTLAEPGTSVKEADLVGTGGLGASISFRATLAGQDTTTVEQYQTVERTDTETVTITDAEKASLTESSKFGGGLFGAGINGYNLSKTAVDQGTEVPYSVGTENQHPQAVRNYENHLAGNPAATPARSNQFREVSHKDFYGVETYSSVKAGKNTTGKIQATGSTERTVAEDNFRTDAVHVRGAQVDHVDTHTYTRDPIDIAPGDGTAVSLSIAETTTYDGSGHIDESITLSRGNLTITTTGDDLRANIDHLRASGVQLGPLAESIDQSASIAWGARHTAPNLFSDGAPPTRDHIAELVDHLANLGTDGTYDRVPQPVDNDHAAVAIDSSAATDETVGLPSEGYESAPGAATATYGTFDQSTVDGDESSVAATSDDGFGDMDDFDAGSDSSGGIAHSPNNATADHGYADTSHTSDTNYGNSTDTATTNDGYATADHGYANTSHRSDSNPNDTADTATTNDGYTTADHGYANASHTSDTSYGNSTDTANTATTNDGYATADHGHSDGTTPY